jgi:hypothetical protein
MTTESELENEMSFFSTEGRNSVRLIVTIIVIIMLANSNSRELVSSQHGQALFYSFT